MIRVIPVGGPGDLEPATVERLGRIHEEAFPAEERQLSIRYMVDRAGRPDSILLVATSDGAAVGYAYVELPRAAPYAFLWYMAVEAGHRDQGIGRELITDLVEALRRDRPERRILLFEVHRPSADDTAGNSLDRRRIEFYRRLGARWVRGIDYRIPAAGDASVSLAYDPMFVALHDSFDPEEVARGIVAMAEDSYLDRLTDPRFLQVQASVTGMVIA